MLSDVWCSRLAEARLTVYPPTDWVSELFVLWEWDWLSSAQPTELPVIILSFYFITKNDLIKENNYIILLKRDFININ